MNKIISMLLLFGSLLFGQIQQVTTIGFKPEKLSSNSLFSANVKEENPYGNKISPNIFLLQNYLHKNKSGKYVFTEQAKSLQNIIQFSVLEKDKIYISVLIKTVNVERVKRLIESNYGFVHSQVNEILTAEIPLNEIEKIANEPDVLYIDASMIREEKLDVSRGEIRADLVNNNLGINGTGVVVGVLDSGIDWTHPVFAGNSGTRIKYLWDESGSGNPPTGFTYGTEYTKAEIDAGTCNETDGNDGEGHGTHVSSIAAGYDNILGTYHGIASGADIVFVKGFRNGPGFADNDVVDGCNYIFSKAQTLGEPCVINLSLGGHFGPHDGTSLYEQALSGLTGQGKVLVVAAGNEGGDYIHAGYAASGSSINEAQQTLFVAHQGAQTLYIDLWYPTGDINLGIAAYDANGNMLTYTNPIAPGESVNNQPLTDGTNTYAYYSIDATTTNDPNNHAKRVVLVLDSHNGTYNLNAGFWSLYTYGSGTFDAWVVTGGNFTTDNYPSSRIHAGDNDKSVGMPSTAQKVICVGSYMTKKCWTDVNGNQRCYQSGEVGDISSFSSRGPSRDGRIKPDITAPGQAIGAALSSFVTGLDPSWILSGNKFRIMQGTSMATPHITGVVALMLQKNPNLDYNSTLTYLTSTARSDAHTGSLPNNNFGKGKVDAYAAVQAVSGGGGGGTQVTMIDEHFENTTFPPSGWQQQVTVSGYTWKSGNVQGHPFSEIDPSSSYSAICSWAAQDQDEVLFSPPFSLGSGEAYVHFYAGHSTDWLTNATLKLHISTDGGNSWNQLWEAQNDGQGWIWREVQVDLTSYQNNRNLYLAWQYVGNDGDIAALDNVKIVGYEYQNGVGDDETANKYALYQNYPNPFSKGYGENPTTTIKYSIPRSEHVTVTVYNVLGEVVQTLVNKSQSPGIYTVSFDGSNFSSGVYFYSIETSNYRETKKMLLLK